VYSKIFKIEKLKSAIIFTFTEWQKQKPYFSVRVVVRNLPNGWGDALRVVNGTLLWKK
jgi:hypothetical protein